MEAIDVLENFLGFITQSASRKIKQSELRQKEYHAKRETLTEKYMNLISIVNLFPNESPNDIIQNIKYGPNYSLEKYDAIFRSLDYKIEDYEKQKKFSNLDYERKNNIEIEISNIKYAKEKLAVNRKSYHKAVKEYSSFTNSDKALFDLYASQEVRNYLVSFKVVIDNVFISGMSVEDFNDPFKNIIKISRSELINAMRKDIGII